MRALRPALLLLGFVLALTGGIWILQGLGHLAWPAFSPMLGRRVWVDYGAAVAVAGLLMLLVARRLPRR